MKERTLKTKLLTVLLTLCMVLSIVPITAFAAGVNYIDKISVSYNAPDYKAGDAPQAAATVTEGNCSVAYEYWREIYQPEGGGVWQGTGRYWYSDADKMASLAADKQITQFEAGHSYSYNIVLKADSGYFISGDTTDISVGNYNWGTVDKTPNLEIKNMSTELHIHSPYSIDIPADDAPIAITLVDFGNVWKNLDSTKPVVFTTELNPNTDCPKQMEITDQAWVENDSSASISSNAYPEAGKEYVYEITLTAKEGYYFQTFYGTFDGKVIVDGVEKYSFGHGDAVPDVYDNGKTLKVKVYPAVIATNGTSQGDTTINNAYIENVKFDYRPGDAPQATAQVEDSSSDRYEVAYECWEEMENGEPVAFWYSDESKYTPSMKKITQFEEGKTYMYSIELREKNGYTFADNCSVMINWSPISATANVVKTMDGLFAMNVETIRPEATKEISVIEINNATLTFKDGDKPVFTGTVPENDQYAFRCEWWSLDENTGIVSTEPEWGGDIYTNKITAFEVGKTYHYGVYVTAYTADISPDAKLKINGREVEYTRIGDENDTQSFWVETDLTMTPAADGDTHNYGTDWKYDSTNHWHECSCGDKSDLTAHSFKWLVDKEATATEKGAKHEECTVCGYKKAAVEIPATGSGNGSADRTTKPSNTSSPQTGDNSNMFLWIALLFVSGGVLTALGITGKKKRITE